MSYTRKYGTPFINDIYPYTHIDANGFTATYKNQPISYPFITHPVTRDINALINIKQNQLNFLQLEIMSINISDTMKSVKIKEKIKTISSQLMLDICADHPNAFWNRKKHIVSLPYEENFSEDKISF